MVDLERNLKNEKNKIISCLKLRVVMAVMDVKFIIQPKDLPRFKSRQNYKIQSQFQFPDMSPLNVKTCRMIQEIAGILNKVFFKLTLKFA